MSRSLKYPIYKDKANKSDKRLANKKIRRFLKKLEKGFKSINFFHKLYNSYNICDYKIDPRDQEDKIKASRK